MAAALKMNLKLNGAMDNSSCLLGKDYRKNNYLLNSTPAVEVGQGGDLQRARAPWLLNNLQEFTGVGIDLVHRRRGVVGVQLLDDRADSLD